MTEKLKPNREPNEYLNFQIKIIYLKILITFNFK